MQVYKIIAKNDISTMQEIVKRYGFNPNKSNKKKRQKENKSDREIKELMQHDSYRRINGRMKQRRWG